MKNGVFILGTDTDIGKTFISGLILKSLRDSGINAGYFKGVLSGAIKEKEQSPKGDIRIIRPVLSEETREKYKLIPGDCKFVCDVSGLEKNYKEMISYTLEHPYSPHLASRIEGVNIKLEKIKYDYENLSTKFDFIVCEGSGGVICPIKIEDEIILLEDIVKMINLPIILVARSGLGTINHTILTIRYLENLGLNIKGIVLNEFDFKNEIHVDNKKVIERLSNVKNIVCIPKVSNLESINLCEFTNLIY